MPINKKARGGKLFQQRSPAILKSFLTHGCAGSHLKHRVNLDNEQTVDIIIREKTKGTDCEN
jgi:hypothetical protein